MALLESAAAGCAKGVLTALAGPAAPFVALGIAAAVVIAASSNGDKDTKREPASS